MQNLRNIPHLRCGLLLLVTLLAACGGSSGSGSGGSSGGGGSGGVGTTDNLAPQGYSISGFTNPIDISNQGSVSFTVAGAEVGTTYFYEIISSGGAGVVEGTGNVSLASFQLGGIDSSSLTDGILELSFYLQDNTGNKGLEVTSTANKNTTSVGTVVISGEITFDRVPWSKVFRRLNYQATSQEYARGVVVEAVDAANLELVSTTTDEVGAYSLLVPENEDVRIRVRAEMSRNDSVSWDLVVKDNTNGDAIYVLQGNLINSGSANSTRNLHAASGWSGAAYTETRAAAPFAILDTVYRAMNRFVSVDPDIDFPPLEIFWSTSNNSANGEVTDGDIGTSFYRDGAIYILGDADGDTDEYDDHIIVHEWAHYLENGLFRTDSIGGAHTFGDRIDMRVAFSEGWSNAISAIALEDPIYFDSSGPAQSQGFTLDLEDSRHSTEGWYSELSVGSITYDLYDAEDDGVDMLELGLLPIYEVLTAPDYLSSDYLSSIFMFLDRMKQQVSSAAVEIDALALGQDIYGTGPDGGGEINDGGIAETLPIYKSVSIDGSPVELCSTDAAGTGEDNYNSLGARDFAYLEVATTQSLQITITKVSGDTDRDPGMWIWRQGLILKSETGVVDQETWNGTLGAGNYVLEVYDYEVIKEESSGGDSCYELRVVSN